MTRSETFIVLVALALVSGLGLAGCNKEYLNENDLLRARIVDLERAVLTLERANGELSAEIAAGERLPETLPAEIREVIPHVTGIDIGRLSHIRGAAPEYTLVLYVTPRDGLGRFIQLVGSLSVTAALLPAEAEAQTIGHVILAPRALRDAYRASFAGRHYSVTVPLSIDTPPISAGMTCDARVHYDDALTGRRFTAHREIAIQP